MAQLAHRLIEAGGVLLYLHSMLTGLGSLGRGLRHALDHRIHGQGSLAYVARNLCCRPCASTDEAIEPAIVSISPIG